MGAPAVAAVVLMQIQSASPQVPPPEVSPARETTRQLAQAVANPLADLASLAFQFNWDTGVGPNHDLRTTLNIQPQVPIPLTQHLTLLSRFLLPFVSQPVLGTGSDPAFGFGDVLFSFFLTPRQAHPLIWAVGPTFGLPMTTDPRLGDGTWQAGPAGGAVFVKGSWQVGVVVTQLFPFADTGDRNRARVNHTSVLPLITYTTARLLTFTLQSETTIDWIANGDRRTTIPIDLLVSRLRLGFLPLSVQLGGGLFLDTPSGGPDWRLRLTFVVVVPQRD